jgi:hypothetical protein
MFLLLLLTYFNTLINQMTKLITIITATLDHHLPQHQQICHPHLLTLHLVFAYSIIQIDYLDSPNHLLSVLSSILFVRMLCC